MLCALPALVRAAPENITDGELALLPEYCQDVQAIRYGNASYNPSPRATYWVGLMGQSFWSLHHYCWGMIHVRRAQQPGVPPAQRTGMITSAIGDYGYVIQNSPRDFILAPEIFLRIGEAQFLLGSTGSAGEAFRAARELKPDYWPAYTRWIDALLKTNQRAEAKALAAEGLRYSPNAKELVDRYRKLGGDPGTVVPVASAIAASAPSEGAADAPITAASAASAASR